MPGHSKCNNIAKSINKDLISSISAVWAQSAFDGFQSAFKSHA